MSELLPCPFCGGEAEFERMGNARQSCIVRCTDCGASHESGDEDNSGESWNRRHTPPGWQLVPVEPTQEMYREAFDALVPAGDAGAAWRAMLSAAPKPGGE